MGHGVRDHVLRGALALTPRIGATRSALAATLMTAVLIVVPAVILVSVVAHEAPQVVDYLQQVSSNAPQQIERPGK